MAASDSEDMFNNWASDSQITKYLTWKPHKTVEYTRSDDNCKILLLANLSTMYQISLPDSKGCFEKYDYESKVWHFSIGDDKIMYIVKQYRP